MSSTDCVVELSSCVSLGSSFKDPVLLSFICKAEIIVSILTDPAVVKEYSKVRSGEFIFCTLPCHKILLIAVNKYWFNEFVVSSHIPLVEYPTFESYVLSYYNSLK